MEPIDACFLLNNRIKQSVKLYKLVSRFIFAETGEKKKILFGLTGTGYFDMLAYEKFHDGKMTDYIPTDEELEKGFSRLPQL